MRLLFYLKYATRALIREGQRTVLAILCIAFGVLSLVAMQLLSDSIAGMLLGDPRALIGGDARVMRQDLQPLTEADINRIKSLQADGTITAYSLQSWAESWRISVPGNGQVYELNEQPLGVEPQKFPLAGPLHIASPTGASFADAVKTPGDAVITTNMAEKLGLKMGDTFRLIGSPQAPPQQLRVGGLADQVPGSKGDTILYSLETAALLNGAAQPAENVVVTWNDKSHATAVLNEQSWAMTTADDMVTASSDVLDVFNFMLKGAGILGLFVGGVGVANTLQVVLARRKTEIATLKSLGYNRRDLLALFGIETALLGLLGSVVGLLGALAVGAWLTGLFGSIGSFMLDWSPNPLVLLGGLVGGVLTAIIFGLFTIVQASSTRPALLLRELPLKTTWGTRIASGGLLLALLALITVISSVVMGSPTDGAMVVGGALVGLLVLTLLFGGLLIVALKVPTPRLPVLTMARRNLRSQLMRCIFALIALFMGVFAIGLAGTVVVSASDRVAGHMKGTTGPNLAVYARSGDTATVEAQLAAAGVADIGSSIRRPLQSSTINGQSLDLNYIDGRSSENSAWNIDLLGNALPSEGDVLLPAWLQGGDLALAPGSKIDLTMKSGKTMTLNVAGFYEATDFALDEWAQGAIVSRDTALRLSNDAAAIYVGSVPAGQLDEKTLALSRSLPATTVLNGNQVADASIRAFRGLFTFAAGTASLALVAGAVLIANGVGLAVVQRRREIGVLKAVGFSAWRVLSTLLVENALLGLFAGVLGMIGVAITIAVLNLWQPEVGLALDPLLALLMVLISIALALTSTVLVAWQPTRVRPLEVLRAE